MSLQVQIVAGLIILAIVGGGVARHRYVVNELESTRIELQSTTRLLTQEREFTRKANEAAVKQQVRADALEADKRNNPLPPVRVCKSTPARVPQATVPAIVVETPKADDPPADEGDSDIGPELDEFATDAELNLIQCEELIKMAQDLQAS